MRLSRTEFEGILNAVSPFLQGCDAELRLYGSRLDDTRKGGDIDLLLVLHTVSDVTRLLQQKHKMLVGMKKLLGDQKIDLKIAHEQEVVEDPFLQLIVPESLVLHRYERE